jgi:hypothetical protein
VKHKDESIEGVLYWRMKEEDVEILHLFEGTEYMFV